MEVLTPHGTPQPAGVPLVRTGASAEWGTPPVSFGASPDDQMSVAAIRGGEPSLSGDDDSAALPPSGVVALSEPDPEMTAMLSRAARTLGSCGILHRVPTLLGWTSGFSGGVALVFSAPLRCHSFRKCMRSLQGHGRHLLLTRRQAQVQEALRRATQRWRETARREMVTAPLPPPEEGRVENPFVSFCFVLPKTCPTTRLSAPILCPALLSHRQLQKYIFSS